MAKLVKSGCEEQYRVLARSYLHAVLEKTNWTKAELGRRACIAPSTFTRSIQDDGTHISPRTLYKVADVSKVPVPKELIEWISIDPKQDLPAAERQGRENRPSDIFTIHIDVPLYSLISVGTASGVYHLLQRGYTERPNILAGIEKARALIVPDETMEPVFTINHIVETNPAKLARPGDDVVIELDSGQVAIRRLVRMDADRITVAHYNPRYSLSHFERATVRAVEPITFILRP